MNDVWKINDMKDLGYKESLLLHVLPRLLLLIRTQHRPLLISDLFDYAVKVHPSSHAIQS